MDGYALATALGLVERHRRDRDVLVAALARVVAAGLRGGVECYTRGCGAPQGERTG